MSPDTTTVDGVPLTVEQLHSVIAQAAVTAAYVAQVARHRPSVDFARICEESRPGRLTPAFWLALVQGHRAPPVAPADVLAALRAEVRRLRDTARAVRPPTSAPPRYDAIFVAGTAALDDC